MEWPPFQLFTRLAIQLVFMAAVMSNIKELSIFLKNIMEEMLFVHKNIFTNEFLEMVNDVGISIQ
jgi:hypothetical protein